MQSWIAASMPPSHRRREKDSKRKGAHAANREHKSHANDSLDADLLCKILQSNIVKDGGKDPSRPNSLLSPSYNTLSKSCDDMSKCGSHDAGGGHGEERDKMPPETIINDKKYIGLVPAAYVSRSRSHNDIIIHRRLVTPNRYKTASPSALPSAYMEEKYVIRIKKGAHPHRMHKSSSDFLKPTNELCRSLSAQNLHAEDGGSGHGHGSGSGPGSGSGSGSHHRHEIITTFGCAPNSAPSSREVSPESIVQTDSANGNYHHHQAHSPPYPHHNQSEISSTAQEQSSQHHSNNNNNNHHHHHQHHKHNNHHHHHKTSHTTGNIAKSAEHQDRNFHLDLPKPERRHSFVGGQTSYPVSIKSPIRSTDTHSFLSMDGLKRLLTHGKKGHKDTK